MFVFGVAKRGHCVGILLAVLILGSVRPLAAADVEFDRDIQPIFQQHCLKCHSGHQPASGLRLDLRSEAQKGGFSGMSPLLGPPEENELFQRISSTDRTVWMPKGGKHLSDAEIDLIRRWIEEGCPWPDPQPKSSPRRNPWLGPYSDLFDWTWWTLWLSDPALLPHACVSFFERHAAAIMGLLLLVLVQLRLAKAFRQGRPYATGRLRPLCALCARIHLRPAHFLVVVLAVLLYVVCAKFEERRLAIIQAARAAQAAHREPTGPYGWPPVPVRPNHPRRLAGTYYRGNCERNPELFNGGHYLTALLRVELCDGNRNPLQVGDPVPESGLTVRFEIERAPHTADALISDAVMKSVTVTSYARPHDIDSDPAPATPETLPPMLKLESLERNQRWACWYPLPVAPAQTDRLQGLIYVYRGEPSKTTEIHYGISYDIRIADGRITEGSDVWLGSLYVTPALATPQPGKVPLDEWFDYRPIPPITGENSSDPRLLGIPQNGE